MRKDESSENVLRFNDLKYVSWKCGRPELVIARTCQRTEMAASSPPTQDSNLRGMAVSSISLTTFAVGANIVLLRLYVRLKRHTIGWDDYTICVALVNSIGFQRSIC